VDPIVTAGLPTRWLLFDASAPSSPGHRVLRIVPPRGPPRYIKRGQRIGEALEQGLQEGDIQAGLRQGGRILGMFVVERSLPDGAGYVAYFRTSWKRGFQVLRTYRGRSDRLYRDFDRLLRVVRDDFKYTGAITLFVAGDPDLHRFRALLPQDAAGVSTDPASTEQDDIAVPASPPTESKTSDDT
jgi:hypothetical protein